MLESLLEDGETKIALSGNNILKIMKCCAINKLKCFRRFDRIILDRQIQSHIKKENILFDDDIKELKPLCSYYNHQLLFQFIFKR